MSLPQVAVSRALGRGNPSRRERHPEPAGLNRPAGTRIWVAMILFLCSCGPLAAQSRNIRFERISIEHGLSQGTINSMLQDRSGFMWFGTQDGLARYDGHDFEVFRNDDENQAAISDNWIWTLLKDSRGRLWIGTNEGGLNLWLPQTKSFRRYVNDEMNQESLSNNRVRALMEDASGKIWVGTESGLNVFDPVRQTFARFLHDPSNPGSLGHNQIRAIPITTASSHNRMDATANNTTSETNSNLAKVASTTSLTQAGSCPMPPTVVAKAVRPRVAATIFELLKTKPDLVSYATSSTRFFFGSSHNPSM